MHSDAGVYVLHHHHKRGDSEMDMILILYVDNILLLGEDLSKIEDVKMSTRQIVSNEGPWTGLILFGDLHYQRPFEMSHLD